MKLNELRLMVRKELELFLEDFAAKEMPNGSAWKTKNKGWAAKNNQGVVNYWYGPDEAKNKQKANEFKNDSSKKATNELKNSTYQSYSREAGEHASELRKVANDHDRDSAKHSSLGNTKSASNHAQTASDYRKTADKRDRGLKTAAQLSSKKSENVTTELNQSTLQSYKQKSKNSMERETQKTLSGDRSADHSKAQKRARGIATATDKLNTKDYQKPGQKSSIPTDKQKKKKDYISRTTWQNRNRS